MKKLITLLGLMIFCTLSFSSFSNDVSEDTDYVLQVDVDTGIDAVFTIEMDVDVGTPSYFISEVISSDEIVMYTPLTVPYRQVKDINYTTNTTSLVNKRIDLHDYGRLLTVTVIHNTLIANYDSTCQLYKETYGRGLRVPWQNVSVG